MAALWDTGERLLRRLHAEGLSRIALVAWLAGIAPWGLGTLVLGWLSLLRWWTVGVLTSSSWAWWASFAWAPDCMSGARRSPPRSAARLSRWRAPA